MIQPKLSRKAEFTTRMTLLTRIKRDWMLYAMLAPVLLFYLTFNYRPMWGLQIAFKDFSPFKGMEGSPWVGLENFKTFIGGPYFWRLLRNTLMINVVRIAVTFPGPIILAIIFNEMRKSALKSALQTMSYLPHFISMVVVTGMVRSFLSLDGGIINILLEKFGGERVYFLSQPEYFWGIYAIMGLWHSIGMSAVIYVAALVGIDPSLYEAARVDGAGRLWCIWHVSIPGILPTIIIKLILAIGTLLNSGAETIILLYSPATYETADVIGTYVYRIGLLDQSYGLASAVGLMNSVVAFILVISANALSKRAADSQLF